MEDYRPIGLTDPVGKQCWERSTNNITRPCMTPWHSFHSTRICPRGVPQALMRAFQHLHHAREVVAQQRITLQQRHARKCRQQLVGAITVSLDLSKAFDSLEPQFMQAFEMSCLPGDVCRLIEHWHHGILYNIEHEKCQVQVQCNRCIRQSARSHPGGGHSSPYSL